MDYALIKELESKHSLKVAHRRLHFSTGQGNRLFDVSGNAYVDFVGGGKNCLGYNNPILKNALKTQLDNLINAPFPHDCYAPALSSIIHNEPSFLKTAITNSPAEANILAVEVAKNYFAEYGSHRENVVEVSGSALNNFALLKEKLNQNTCAMVVEPVTDGVHFAQYDFMLNAYVLAKSMDILFICNETRVGTGRLGKRFAYETFGIQPDIVTLGWGMGGGVAAGGVLVKSALKYKSEHNKLDTASALACVAVNTVADYLTAERIAMIAETGEYLMSKLVKLNKHNFIVNIRGKGLLAGIELAERVAGARIVGQMSKLGYLIGLSDGNVLKFCPPLTITREEIDGMVDALSSIFASTNI